MYRITDPARSIAFYGALGLELKRQVPTDEATMYFLGMRGEDEVLELTFRHHDSRHDLSPDFGHIAIGLDDLDATLAQLAKQGIAPERPPYQVAEGGSWLCFVRDPDEYRVELIARPV